MSNHIPERGIYNFQCDIITPMFLGGAKKQSAELRPPSIKGALRYWWRAINGSNYINGTSDADYEKGIQALKKAEADIFGSDDQKVGKSKFSIAIHTNTQATRFRAPKFNERIGRRTKDLYKYLSFGAHTPQQQHYAPAERFTLQIKFAKTAKQALIDGKSIESHVLEALAALHYFGGLGAKSRNGFGQFAINDQLITDQKETVYQNIRQGKYLPYTGGSKHALIYQSQNRHDSWEKAFEEVGKLYYNIKAADSNYRNSLDDSHHYRNRSILTMPMRLKPARNGDKRQIFPLASHLNRHSKWLYISILPNYQNNQATYRGQMLLLPYEYLWGLSQMKRNNSKEFKKVYLPKQEDIYQTRKDVVNQLDQYFSQHLQKL